MSFWTRLRFEVGPTRQIAKTAEVVYLISGESTEPLVSHIVTEKLSKARYSQDRYGFDKIVDPILDKKCNTESLRLLKEYRENGIKSDNDRHTITGDHIIQCKYSYYANWKSMTYEEWLEMKGLRK